MAAAKQYTLPPHGMRPRWRPEYLWTAPEDVRRRRRDLEQLQARARSLLERPIRYVAVPDDGPAAAPTFERSANGRLSAQLESALFMHMNRLKQRADGLRQHLSPTVPCEFVIDDAEQLLNEADAVRNTLLEVFTPLVISIVRRYIGPRYPYDELQSEGMMCLLRAMEMFDPARGFRFSTYATPAVRRSLERFVMKRHNESRKFACRSAERLDLPADGGSAAADAQRQRTLAALDQMVACLDERERLIVNARFGLSHDAPAETLQAIATRLGISRERVRQLERRALDKLGEMAADQQIEPPEA